MIDLGDLAFARGGHVLVKRALRGVAVGRTVDVCGRDPDLWLHLSAWARLDAHSVERTATGVRITRGAAALGRWKDAARGGDVDPGRGVLDEPDPAWGLAARGATIESGGARFDYPLAHKDVVWSDDAPRLYAAAAAHQWDPATAIDWSAPLEHDEEVEDAVVQLMTYLIENEMAALQVPASFVARIHPHFREVLQVLAVQAADEARHVEVFTRRATLRRQALGSSTVGGRASLKTLLDEPDFALASFLLSVLGEGSFLSLLQFVAEHAPDPVTAQVTRLAGQDEARHVAFGLGHLRRHVERDPAVRGRLAMAVERRHSALRDTSGLNEEVFDALVVMAAGGWEPSAIERGYLLVEALQVEMARGRRVRLEMLGFDDAVAERLAELHTRNFM